MEDNGNSASTYAVPAILVAGAAALFLMTRESKAKKSEKTLIPSGDDSKATEPARANEISVSKDAKESIVGSQWVSDILLPYLRKEWAKREIERWGLNPVGFGYSGDATYWGWDYFFNPEEPGLLEVKHNLRRDLYVNQSGEQRQLAALPSTSAIASLLQFIDGQVDEFVKSQIQRVHDQSWEQGS